MMIFSAFLICLFSVCSGSSTTNILRRVEADPGYIFQMTLFVGEDLAEVDLFVDPLASVSVYPPRFTLPTSLYTFRMTQNTILGKTPGLFSVSPTNPPYPILSPLEFTEFSILVDIYGVDFLFLSFPPKEMTPHLTTSCTIRPPAVGHRGIDFLASVGGVLVNISHGTPVHVVSDPRVCGSQTLVVGTASVDVYVDCSSSLNGTATVLSGLLLGVGQSFNSSVFCLHKGQNNEIDHPLTITIVAVLFIFLTMWIDWTRNLWNRILNKTSNVVWIDTTVSYGILVYQVVIVIVSMNVYSKIQGSHSIYSFSSVRIVGIEMVDTIAAVFSYIVTPLLGMLAIVVLTIGHAFFKPSKITHSEHFTWGRLSFSKLSFFVRVCFFSFVLVCFGGIVYAVWYVWLDDKYGAIAFGVTFFPSIFHFSSPHFIENKLTQSVKENGIDAFSMHLILFTWAVKFLVVTCICNNLPFDVAGHLNTPFHNGVTFSLGIALLIITGRDMAHVVSTCTNELWYLFIVPTVLFVVLYLSIFSLGGMFSYSGALQNYGTVAFVTSAAFSLFVFSLSFSVNLHIDSTPPKKDGIDTDTAKRR
jgi:hypothetical protein